MKIKKYRPNFFSGFEDVYYDVNSKEELLASELCKGCVDDGYEICFSKDKEDYGFIMAIREAKNEEVAEWWVLAIIYNTQDVATLSERLPDWNLKYEEYKNKHMATIKSYTNLEQSRKLAEFLPIETADMWYEDSGIMIPRLGHIPEDYTDTEFPCWSLAALLGILPKIHKLKPLLDLEENSIQYSGIDLYIVANNPLDACYEMIIKLNKLKML